MPAAMARGDEFGAGVGDGGCAGVGDEGDACAGFQLVDELFGAAGFVVQVVADGGRRDAEVVEELCGLAGVLAGDAVGGAEDAESAEGDVFEVADGCGDEIEAGCEGSVGGVVAGHVVWSRQLELEKTLTQRARRRDAKVATAGSEER